MDEFEKKANKSMEATRRRLGDRHRSNLRTVESDFLVEDETYLSISQSGRLNIVNKNEQQLEQTNKMPHQTD